MVGEEVVEVVAVVQPEVALCHEEARTPDKGGLVQDPVFKTILNRGIAHNHGHDHDHDNDVSPIPEHDQRLGLDLKSEV